MKKDFKYIILAQNGFYEFDCGQVFRHSDLLEFGYEERYVLGGGKFRFDPAHKSIILYGGSDDYGWVRDLGSILKKCYEEVRNALAEEYTWHFSKTEEELPEDWDICYQDITGRTYDAKTGSEKDMNL